LSGTIIILIAAVLLMSAYMGKIFWGLVLIGAAGLYVAVGNSFVAAFLCFALLAALVCFAIPALRYRLSDRIMDALGKVLPAIGETEDIALKAGTVWWESDLFSGTPHWQKLLDYKIQKLSQAETEFMEGPVLKLCAMINDHDIAQDRDLPEAVWQFIRDEKFLGLVIAPEYGGLGFSAAGHAAVITKIATMSSAAAVSIMVPNSLGPGELLHHYGNQKQKDYYLPRLARGEEIPCFALTEPHAGSDAANGRSIGIVCRGMHEGQEVLGIMLQFNKRYITLAPIATVIGLAFNLHDPDALLGEKTDIGITCALLPRATAGMQIGEHHDPMGVPFNNGPVRGKDVFIPLDYVIGGREGVGIGWRMLMECLSVGRSISLPSLGVGGAQLATRVISAYATVREQFGLPIHKFEGVREPLARIFISSYWMTATRDITCGAIDSGEKPSVASAIVKRYVTEALRTATNDAMDIQGGAAICRGPRNIFARLFSSIPVSITVEGANILTRSLMVFGQGALRCHPYLLKEMNAIQASDLPGFDKAIFAHINHVIKNATRAFVHALSFSRFATAPNAAASKGAESRHYRQLSRLSAAFAFAADMALLSLGGSLKRKEHISGRYADALAWLYIASSVLKRSHDSARPQDAVLVEASLRLAEYETEDALFGIIANLPNRWAAFAIRALCFPFGRSYKMPNDRLLDAVVDAVLDPVHDLRSNLSTGVFVPEASKPGLGALEAAYAVVLQAQQAQAKLDKLRHAGEIAKGFPAEMIREASDKGLLDESEQQLLVAADTAKDAIIQVDYFDKETYLQLR